MGLAFLIVLAAQGPVPGTGGAAKAGETTVEPVPIRDNSFLIEEAYNQEDGVIQHISAFTRNRDTREWVYTFTEEWPVRGEAHQFSFTLPVQRPGGGAGGDTGVGDAALNYRYQALGGSEGRTSLAPRASLLLPSGDEEQGRGTGGAGLQINLPLSVTLSRSFVAHSNLGATLIPSSRNALGEEATVRDYFAGQSLIWLAGPTFNVMLEAAWSSSEEVTGSSRTSRGSSLFVSPGVRGAINRKSGLQIVPGLAVPIGIGASRGETALFVYLSFEHPFSRAGN
ncbi:MAG: transporter [Acidobacteria bacterium]|nr:transporter [Acidobacteriota bacterium]